MKKIVNIFLISAFAIAGTVASAQKPKTGNAAPKGKPPVAVSAAAAVSGPVDRTKAPAAAPAPKIQIGNYQMFTLENGLKLIVVENHKLPRVSYSISLDIDPVKEGDKAGYANLAGDLMSAGTTSKSKGEIDEAVDFIGASLSSSSDGIFGSCLTKHSEKFLELMSDVLLHPSFPVDELDKSKKQMLSGLSNEKTDPSSLSNKITAVMNFGKDHPYGEIETEESINKITREDLVAFYQTYFKPNVAYLVVVGDIAADQAKAQAEKYFGSWQRGTVTSAKYKTPTAPAGNRVVFVPLPGAVQSVIDVTYPIDLKPGTQDAITASALNNIFGGSGFQTRLMQNLREDKAYTYGAYSSVSPDKYVGSFSAGASVRNEVTDSAIVQFIYEMQRMVNEPVPDSTLKTVKNIMTGSFARSLERPQTIGNFAMNIEKYGLAKDYYETYLQKLNSITSADIQASAKKLVRPENAYITVVGNRDIASKLAVFAKSGKVEMRNADGTEVKEIKPAPAGVTEQTVFMNYINAMGGEKKLSKIKSFEQTGTMAAGPMTLDMDIKMKDKKMIAVSIKMGGQEIMKQTFDGTKGVAVQMGQKTPMDEKDLKDVRMQTDLLAEMHYAQYGIKPTLKGIENVDGVDMYVVELKHDSGKTTTEYYNVATGLKSRSISTEMDGEKAMTSETTIKEYMTLENGVKFPSAIRQSAGPQTMEMTFKEVKLNPKLDKKDFIVE